MRGARTAALGALLLGACLHTRHVGEPASEGQEGSRKESVRAGRPLPSQPGRPPIAPSPQALLAPGGAREIQGALSRRGLLAEGERTGKLDEKTSAALRRFQEQQDLPATGAPDHETLRQLGLDPRRVFQTKPGSDEAREPELEQKGEK